jgi:hypothetical protein
VVLKGWLWEEKKKSVDGGDDEEARGEEVAGRSSSQSMFELGRKGKNKK